MKTSTVLIFAAVAVTVLFVITGLRNPEVAAYEADLFDAQQSAHALDLYFEAY
ncbi:MAG: hypothetical protein AB8F95_16765 [Bacteroidia bacterium]